MAAADYYNSSPPTGDPHRHDTVTPVSALSHSVSSVSANSNKPLPPPVPHHQNTFPPTTPAPYNDDLSYASNHYSQHSIDTSYDSHAYNNNNNQYYNQTPSPAKAEGHFSDNIPLTDAHHNGHKPPLAAVAMPFPGGVRKKSKQVSWLRRRPWFMYLMTVIDVAVFCGEIGRNASLTGTPIMLKPSFNYMIGPSTYVLINMGARYVPCMKKLEGVNDFTIDQKIYPCPNTTNLDGPKCMLSTFCGFGANEITADSPPNQWFRFITPMFLHAGLIHLAFNMFMQVMLGGDMERQIGMLRVAIVYFVSGIFGFVLGGNLGMRGEPSVGASGCLFGIFALVLLDILYTWRERRSPGKDLIFLLIDIVISFVLGLLPFIDNYAHIGGFLAGIALGMVFMHSPNQLRKRLGNSNTSVDPPYTQAVPTNPYNTSTGDNNLTGVGGFAKQPLGFFKGRRPMWWAWWLVRAAMLTVILVAMIVMLNSFYKGKNNCTWCKYLSCLPVNNWCEESYFLEITNSTSNGTSPARMLMRSLPQLRDLSEFF